MAARERKTAPQSMVVLEADGVDQTDWVVDVQLELPLDKQSDRDWRAPSRFRRREPRGERRWIRT